jgi:hypothetical protein
MPERSTTEPAVWSELPRARRQRLAVLIGRLAWRMARDLDPAEAGHERLEQRQRDAAGQGRGPSS